MRHIQNLRLSDILIPKTTRVKLLERKTQSDERNESEASSGINLEFLLVVFLILDVVNDGN